ncbi:MAG: indole-3-glycerol phosphate synthase [uncultured bacterium]|nr:MAG: indole-3-glycerol phosphate synthase [uncultured bacterium]
MKNKLESIILQKKKEVELLHQYIAQHQNHPIAQILQGNLQLKPTANFKKNLKLPYIAIIAEIKRKSPSKGMIAEITDPVFLAKRYISAGANALSILTDTQFFGGYLTDLTKVANFVNTQSIPILRKDFMIDPIQIAEAAVAGASAVLCIVSVLGKKTKSMLEFAHSINMNALVEIHDINELKIALDSGADIIGINNRNLNTFRVDTHCALELSEKIPNTIIKVAESGITEPRLVQQYAEAGFDAVLIGEALVKSDEPAKFIKECRHEK